MLNQIKNSISSLECKEILVFFIVVICILWLIAYMSYFNAFVIVRDYINQFKENNGKYNKGLLFGAVVVPALLAIFVLIYGPSEMTSNAINGITLIITVLTALFFTIIGLVAELKVKIQESENSAGDKKILNRLCVFIFQADMFEIVVCILLLIACFCYMLGIMETLWLQFVIYYLSFVVIINIFILMKRLYVVLEQLLK